MKDNYADVIVDITHENVDRTFQYRIPPALRGEITEGSQVRIPFGNGNRNICGYVIGIGGEPKVEEDRIKTILEVDHDKVTAESQMIRLAAWMRQTYGSTMIRALKTILPVRQKENNREKKTVFLNADRAQTEAFLEECRRKNHKARVRALEALLEAGSMERSALIRQGNISSAVLKDLEGQGIIRQESEVLWRNPSEMAGSTPEEFDISLTPEQQNVLEEILSEWAGRDRPGLLNGVTGSGKTRIYMELIDRILREEKQAIVLIPEISLSWQIVQRFRRKFGDRVAVLHSRMSAGERSDQLERVKKGEAKIMVGPRSALFTPFPDLGLIVVDEEQDTSYRSGQAPRYDARETALERGKMEGAHVLFGSATPSVDTMYRCEKGTFALYTLENRYGEASLPDVLAVDMRKELRSGNRSILSRALQERIGQRLEKKEQVLLFLNRRGLAGFMSCRSCGHVIKCPHCDVSLTMHAEGRLICHYCGYQTPEMNLCPKCGSPYIGGFRAGTQKVEQEVQRLFPEARVLRMDADTTRGKEGHGKILEAFASQEADILIGTQMIVKGHDFPNVTLVGVLAADLSLFASDYRAAERTYQLLVQAIGRAGRGSLKGEAIIQTYHPEHYSIQSAMEQDYLSFYREEMDCRLLMGYPPAENMLAVHGACDSEEKLETAMEHIRKYLERIKKKPSTNLTGPAPESVSKVQDMFRRVLYIKEGSMTEICRLRELLEKYIEMNTGFRNVFFQYDLNA